MCLTKNVNRKYIFIVQLFCQQCQFGITICEKSQHVASYIFYNVVHSSDHTTLSEKSTSLSNQTGILGLNQKVDQKIARQKCTSYLCF